MTEKSVDTDVKNHSNNKYKNGWLDIGMNQKNRLAHFKYILHVGFDHHPHPGVGTPGSVFMMKMPTSQGRYGQNIMLSDAWILRYTPLEKL